MPSVKIPETLDAQAALYRSTLAGKRMLILLDNARDEGQVRPLLPGGTACPVLITSRSLLTGLVAAEGAHPLSLDVLSDEDSCELLTRQLGAQRVSAEPEAARALAGLCAGLPLALAVAAARAAARPALPLAALAAELQRAGAAGRAGDRRCRQQRAGGALLVLPSAQQHGVADVPPAGRAPGA